MRKLIGIGLIVAFVLVVLAASTPAPVRAQMGGDDIPEGVSEDEVYRVSRQMYCDVCQGVPISDCPSPTCQAWREKVGDLLAEGYNDEQILQYFATYYGDKVSGVPIQSEDRNLALSLPALAAILLGVVVVWQVWSLRQRGDSRALQAARSAGVRMINNRPVPDNVDEAYLDRFLKLVEDKQ